MLTFEEINQIAGPDSPAAKVGQKIAALERENVRLRALNAELLAALTDITEIARFRWRRLPVDTPEKKRLAAAADAIAKARE